MKFDSRKFPRFQEEVLKIHMKSHYWGKIGFFLQEMRPCFNNKQIIFTILIIWFILSGQKNAVKPKLACG